MGEKILKINFIETTLLGQILENNPDLKNQEIVKCTVSATETLDGFMSAIFMIELEVKCTETQKNTVHSMIVKLMKGDEQFRISTRSNIQFENEVYIYTRVISAFRDFLHQSPSNIKIDNWIPRPYHGFYGKIPELSNMNESILVVENISPKGFRNGPRCELDEPHLYLMTKLIAEYHAISYAMKIKAPEQFKKLVDGIIPFVFDESALYDVLYKVGFHRFFLHLNRVSCTAKLRKDTENLRTHYGDDPVALLERVRRYDGPFSVILHGDYNRNNVLFRYESDEGYDNPKDLRMIDFQEVRYGTPCFDLSFFLYMNMDPKLRNLLWDKLLKYYHENVINCLADILNCPRDDDMLKPYSFDKFIQHFTDYAFYGAMVCIHFIPWMLCQKDECNKLSQLFETDMHGEEFHEFSIVVGGDVPDKRILGIVEHASEKGYMQFLDK